MAMKIKATVQSVRDFIVTHIRVLRRGTVLGLAIALTTLTPVYAATLADQYTITPDCTGTSTIQTLFQKLINSAAGLMTVIALGGGLLFLIVGVIMLLVKPGAAKVLIGRALATFGGLLLLGAVVGIIFGHVGGC